MSLMCPMKGCEDKPGMCKCEKIMSAIAILVAVGLLVKAFPDLDFFQF